MSIGDSTFSNIAVVRFHDNGIPDTSFGTGGKVITDLGKGYEAAYDAILQADGKIVVVGYSSSDTSLSDFAVIRYNPDGTPDNTFGINGTIITEVSAGRRPSKFGSNTAGWKACCRRVF